MPTVERVGDRIHLRHDGYMPDTMYRKASSIVGHSWRKRDRIFTYPLDMVVCRDLRAAFGPTLQIGPELWRWSAEQARREKRLIELLSARDTDNLRLLPERAPLIWAAMNDDKCMEPGCRIGMRKHKPDHIVMSHRYQKPVVEYMALARNSQNASQPGLGKTIETLGAIIEADVRGLVLVSCPKKAIRSVWEPEVRRWLPGVPVFGCTGGYGRRLDTIKTAMKTWAEGHHSLVFVIINPEMLQTKRIETCLECDGSPETHFDDHKMATHFEHKYPVLFEQTWTAAIVDETHKYALKVNLRSKKKSTQTGTGIMMLNMASDGMKIGLSGTPWKGKVRNAWSIRHWLDGDIGLSASFWNWAGRMLVVEEGEYSMNVGGVRDEEAFNRWCDSFMIRHTKAEMAPWLPPKSYGGTPLDPSDPNSPVGVWLDMDGKQEKAYKAMEEHATVQLDSGLLIGNGVLAEMTRLKQFACMYGDIVDRVVKGDIIKSFVPKLPSNKFDKILEMLEERGIRGTDSDGDGKIVIASQFTQMVNLISSELTKMGINNFRITGETGDKQADDYRIRFQEDDDTRVMLINTMAGGVSLTLDAADDLIFFDETWIPDDQEQVEDRTHRTSRIHNVTIYYLRTLGTIDERIALVTQELDDIQKRLLDGRRGVQFAKRLLEVS